MTAKKKGVRAQLLKQSGGIQWSHSIEFSEGDSSLSAMDLPEDEASFDEWTDKHQVTKQNGPHTGNQFFHDLGTRSLSPRPQSKTHHPIRLAASAGSVGRFQGKQRKAYQSKRQQSQAPATRTETPQCLSAVQKSSMLTSSKLLDLLRPSSVTEPSRERSILDEEIPSQLSYTDLLRASQTLNSLCCSSDDIDQVSRSSVAKTCVIESKISSVLSDAFPAATKPNHVLLHIYDLITPDTMIQLPFGCMCEIGKCFKDLNDSLHLMGTGAYHVGVEINGVEYAFGACSTPGKSGVFPCTPRNSPGYQYRTSVDFGERVVARRSNVVVLQGDHTVEFEDDVEYLDGRDIVRSMAKEYMGTDYDILRKNCCTFARDVCRRFGIQDNEIPSWFSNLAESGAMTQDIATATVQPFKLFSLCDLDTALYESYEIKMGKEVWCT